MWKRFNALPLLFVIFMTNLPGSVQGQWEKVISFDSSRIKNLYFINGESCNPRIGFISVNHFGQVRYNELLRTQDGGKTWIAVPGVSPGPDAFVFRSNSVGWGAGSGVTTTVIKTTDAGVSWFPTALSTNAQFWAISYSFATRRLFVAESNSMYFSSDDGLSWKVLSSDQEQGLAFSTPLLGIGSGAGGAAGIYTHDGGLTWANTTLKGEQYQPNGDKRTGIFFAVSERGPTWVTNGLFRSDNGGASWNQVYLFPSDDTLSGTIIGDSCHLFLQDIHGIMESTDQGLSWNAIGGPAHSWDIRMSIAGGYLYAADQLAYSHDGTTSLWRYKLGSKFVAIPGQLSASTCNQTDTTIDFFVQGNCRNSIVSNLGLSGSSTFQFLKRPALPDTLIADDSVRIRYTPLSSKPDTAYLLLSLCTPSGPIDTSIALYGSGIKSPNVVHLSTKVSPAVIHANDIVTMQVYPDQLIKNAQLNTLDLDLSYLDDLLELVSVKTSVAGASVTTSAKSVVGGRMKLPISLSGSDMTLDPAQPVLEISFHAFLSDSTSTDLTLSNLKLNGSDPSYQCKLAADIASPNVTIQLQCGDPTVQQFLRTKTLLLESIHPNPANRTVSVSLSGGANSKVNVAIYDVLGKLVIERSTVLGSSELTLDVDLSKLVAGSYILRVSDDRGMASSKRLVVER